MARPREDELATLLTSELENVIIDSSLQSHPVIKSMWDRVLEENGGKAAKPEGLSLSPVSVITDLSLSSPSTLICEDGVVEADRPQTVNEGAKN